MHYKQIQMWKILTLGRLDKHRSIFANQKWLHEKLRRHNRIRSSIRKVQPWKRSKTWKSKIKLKKMFFFNLFFFLKILTIWSNWEEHGNSLESLFLQICCSRCWQVLVDRKFVDGCLILHWSPEKVFERFENKMFLKFFKNICFFFLLFL